MDNVLQFPVSLARTECVSCGIKFAIPDNLLAAKKDNGTIFYCPNGHQLAFLNEEEKKEERRDVQILESALQKILGLPKGILGRGAADAKSIAWTALCTIKQVRA